MIVLEVTPEEMGMIVQALSHFYRNNGGWGGDQPYADRVELLRQKIAAIGEHYQNNPELRP